jgi:putative Mg2+ transporter-C (MgtC) family protein
MMEEIIMLLLAVWVGGLIGLEREFRHGMGLRTLMLVCLGATMFTIYSDHFAFGEGDPRRIAAAVVTGVGFLGAGVILREKGRILGLTTAASVWAVAALGMGIGMGMYAMVAVGTLLMIGILWGIPRLTLLSKARITRTYQATCSFDQEKHAELTALFHTAKLTVNKETISKHGDRMVCTWNVVGDPDSHKQVMQNFMTDPAVIEFDAV